MRYRLMATYRGAAYEAGVGPTDRDVTLFAALPPPEELGFEPATGHWRKAVSRAEVDAVWESRPSGMFRGEPCTGTSATSAMISPAPGGSDTPRWNRACLNCWPIART
jgi:hypothetical protein